MISKPEPPPSEGTGPELWPRVIDRHGKGRSAFVAAARSRHEFGIAKYGTALRAGNGRDWLIDAIQEALDLVVYYEQGIAESSDPMERVYIGNLQEAQVGIVCGLLSMHEGRQYVQAG